MLSALFYQAKRPACQVHFACLSLHLPDPHNPSRLSNFLGAWKQERNEQTRISWRSNAFHVPSISAGCCPHFLVLRDRDFLAGSSEHIPWERGAGSEVQLSPWTAGRGPSTPGAPPRVRLTFRCLGTHPSVHWGASSAHATYFLSNFSHLEDQTT